MNYLLLRNLNKLYFPYKDLAKILHIKDNSAKELAKRYVKKGYLLRLKRNYYILSEKWDYLNIEEKFCIANILQVPSYISLTTALSYYGYTTQVQREYYESISIYRTKKFEINNIVFNYSKIKRRLYFGFLKKENFFIATPEKALLDSLYLTVNDKYNIDISAVEWKKFDKKLLFKYLNRYPEKIKVKIMNLWKI